MVISHSYVSLPEGISWDFSNFLWIFLQYVKSLVPTSFQLFFIVGYWLYWQQQKIWTIVDWLLVDLPLWKMMKWKSVGMIFHSQYDGKVIISIYWESSSTILLFHINCYCSKPPVESSGIHQQRFNRWDGSDRNFSPTCFGDLAQERHGAVASFFLPVISHGIPVPGSKWWNNGTPMALQMLFFHMFF